MQKNIVIASAVIIVVSIATFSFLKFGNDQVRNAAPGQEIGDMVSSGGTVQEKSETPDGDSKALEVPTEKMSYDLWNAFADYASGKIAAKEIDIEKLPLPGNIMLSSLGAVFLKLRDEGSDIPEKLLNQKEYDYRQFAMDPRVLLEGYLYQQYKARGEYDPIKLGVMPIGNDNTLQLVLKEIYANHPEDFKKFGEQVIKRQGVSSSRIFSVTVRMIAQAIGKEDAADPAYILQNQRNFFLKWPGWSDLTVNEKNVLMDGSRIFDRYATMSDADFKTNIDKEISDFEKYMEKYDKAGLNTFWAGTYFLAFMHGNLYVIKGDYDKAIKVATDRLNNTTLIPRVEQNGAFNKNFVAIWSRIGFLHLHKGKDLESKGKIKEAIESYRTAEKLMHDDLLIMPLTTPDVFVVWTDLKKKIESLSK